MKRTYADLHLHVNFDDLQQVSRVAGRALSFGYGLVAMPFLPSLSEVQVRQVQRICADVGIGFASRVDLRPRTPEELLNGLRRLRRRFEIVAILCESKKVARQAAKDRRVDLLSFPQLDFRRRFFDAAEAELASGSLASFEIDMEPLLTLNGAARIRLLSTLRRETAVAKQFHVPIVISSGASDELLMRRPLDLAALAALFDLKGQSGIEAVSGNPVAIIKRNREKLSPSFVAPGIRVIRRGKDC